MHRPHRRRDSSIHFIAVPLSRAACKRHSRCRIPIGFLICAIGVGSAQGQLRPVAVRDATIFTGNGPWIEKATVLVQAGKYSGVGTNVDVPMLARKFDGKGKFVTPGLIDVWGPVAATVEAGGDPTARAQDAFDYYSDDQIKSALAGGVTAVFLPATPPDGIGGQGAVFRLRPRSTPNDAMVGGSATLCAAIGTSPGQTPIQRVRTWMSIRKQFDEAREYREAWEAYEEELKEYDEKLQKLAKGEPIEDDEKKGEKGESKPAPAGVARTADTTTDEGGTPTEYESTEPDQGTAAIDGEPRPRPNRRRPNPEDLRRLEELRERAGGGERSADGDKEKKTKIKKPVEPAKDRKKEFLLKLIDGEVALRVAADRPEDILNALDLAARHRLRLLIEGSRGAHLVADKLADADVPVIFEPPSQRLQFQPGPAEFESADAVSILMKAGVPVYLGSGDAASTRHLALHAAYRAGNGMTADEALESITSRAAELLGVDKEMGRITDGAPADFVVWSAHPFAPGARVDRVFIGGTEVFTAEDAGE